MNNPDAIKIAAVITAIPRWVVALMAAEGLSVPAEWHFYWVIFSAASAVGMAIVEGMAFSYVFSAIKKSWQLKNTAHIYTLSALAMVSAILFVSMLAPALSATVRGVTVGKWISSDLALTLWQVIVAGSTIAIVASVGYAETIMQAQSPAQPPAKLSKDTAKVTPSSTSAQLPQNSPEVTQVIAEDIPAQRYPSRYEALKEEQRLEIVSLVSGMDRAEAVKVIAAECRISAVSARKWYDKLYGVVK